MFGDIISYIRSWFPTSETVSKKRRAPEALRCFDSPKYRKVLSPLNPTDDDWFRLTPSLSPIRIPERRSFTRVCPIIIDDDDGRPKVRDIEIKLTGKKFSTPENNRSKMNGHDDDVSFVRTIKLPSETNGKSYGTNSNCFATKQEKKSKNSFATSQNRSRSRLFSPSLDYSIRLDDHRRYKELLENFSSQNLSTYHTPAGKLSDYDICNNSRSRKILNLAKGKSPDIVDLTKEGSSNNKPYLSTKDAVIKILDDFESKSDETPIEVQDSSESDVEILPNPPSPKPDIKIDPVNSLKTVMNTNTATQPKWLREMDETHDRIIQERKRQIKAMEENSSALNEINQELLLKTLAQKVESSMQIKDVILPVIEIEDEIELPPLTEEQLQVVRRGLHGPNEILTKKFNLHISRKDIQTLAGLNWLNDNVINFYMNLIIERSNSDKWPNTYCMNTFFYPKLKSSGPESIKRWTKKVDIFAMEFICVPIHLGVHWCMAIINLKQKYIKYYDSMGHSNNTCLELLKNYLEFEHMDKKKEPFSADDFLLENVKDIPQQLNGSDCGMFSCTFAEFETRRAKFTFGQEDMPYLRKKMVYEILTGELMIK